MYTINQLGIDRIEEIMAFDRLCFPTDCWREEDWQDLLADPGAVYYAFTDKDKIIADVFVFNWKGQDDYVKIMNVAVHPDYRNKALARRLLNHAAEEMKKEEMYIFRGETRASNTAMQKVFEECGYLLDKTEENYYSNPTEDAFKYVLYL